MELYIKKISSLEKIRSFENDYKVAPDNIKLLGGEHYAYQLVVTTADISAKVNVSIDSDIKEYINIYSVSDVPMDRVTHDSPTDDNYITKNTGLMPDLLIPINKTNDTLVIARNSQEANGYAFKTLWIDINLPKGIEADDHYITIKLEAENFYGTPENATISDTTHIQFIPTNLPDNEICYTQWFYNDCIASAHDVEIYSEKHWTLIEKYIKLAAQLEINTILTPVFTPPLDTQIGYYRPNVQLVKISEENNKYSFDFNLLDRFIEIAKSNGIKNFEICHLYSQWGLKSAPAVYVNNELKFGWHTQSDSVEYIDFLNQFLPELITHLKKKGIDKTNCLFHISDEPNVNAIENYKKAYNVIRPLIGDIKILDAMSNINFYNMGLMDIPVCASDHIEAFLEANIDELWTYYCCCQTNGVSNRFIAMPSTRTRAIGLHMYKYGIKGFLQWGYNFYYSTRSLYPINPLLTTSAGGGFPSGDSFSVYPYGDDVLPSLRSIIFKDALQDVRLMKLAENLVGKDKIVALFENLAGCEVTFKHCPRNIDFYETLVKELKTVIEKNL